MILGRPGAGKTTFLKYVATFTNSSKILPEYFPIYIPLKDFQDKDGHINLLTYIENDLSFFEISKEIFHRILKASKVIFLFDGLDEVRKENFTVSLDKSKSSHRSLAKIDLSLHADWRLANIHLKTF